MLIVRRKFTIGAHPDDQDIIIDKLKELGCFRPYAKSHRFKIRGQEAYKVYIEDTIDADKLDELIKWLETEIKNVVSITY